MGIFIFFVIWSVIIADFYLLQDVLRCANECERKVLSWWVYEIIVISYINFDGKVERLSEAELKKVKLLLKIRTLCSPIFFKCICKNVCMLICCECVYLLLLLFLNHRKKCFSSVDFLFIIYETLWILILIIEVLLAQMNETFTSLFSIGLIKFFLMFNFGIIRLLIEICLLSINNLYLDLIIVYLQR